jgi:hypothetical protein
VVSHHLDGFRLRDRRGLVASLCRPWGSSRFADRPPLICGARSPPRRRPTLQSVPLQLSLRRVTAPSCLLAVASSRSLDLEALLRPGVRGHTPPLPTPRARCSPGLPVLVASDPIGEPTGCPCTWVRDDPSSPTPNTLRGAPRRPCPDLSASRCRYRTLPPRGPQRAPPGVRTASRCHVASARSVPTVGRCRGGVSAPEGAGHRRADPGRSRGGRVAAVVPSRPEGRRLPRSPRYAPGRSRCVPRLALPVPPALSVAG